MATSNAAAHANVRFEPPAGSLWFFFAQSRLPARRLKAGHCGKQLGSADAARGTLVWKRQAGGLCTLHLQGMRWMDNCQLLHELQQPPGTMQPAGDSGEVALCIGFELRPSEASISERHQGAQLRRVGAGKGASLDAENSFLRHEAAGEQVGESVRTQAVTSLAVV